MSEGCDHIIGLGVTSENDNGKEVLQSQTKYFKTMYQVFNYCPKCGCKLKKEDTNECEQDKVLELDKKEDTKEPKKRHVVVAQESMVSNLKRFVEIENKEDIKGVPAIVKFSIQSDPVSEVGENGCQVSEILEFSKELIKSLNAVFPCRENALSITKIEEAIHWQEHRTKNRQQRNVEGKMEA